MTEPSNLSRRSALMKLGILLNGAIAALLAVPIIGYLLSPLFGKARGGYKAWVSLGPLSQFPEGQTRLATFHNPFIRPWDGQTADIPCWVRRVAGQTFQVFAINCAHLGCPVRWFAQSGLFMCPCHGGIYYADGSRASGPPERGLFTYSYKIENNQLVIQAGALPTLAADAGTAAGGRKPCVG
ncbi:MAG: ubiquinol-cytochrome c reductase iron-sulfur subunit [Terriglobia bacterium]